MGCKGKHSRGYLPHWDFSGVYQGITFRLVDSIPQKVIEKWKYELRGELRSNDPEKKKLAYMQFHQKVSRYEDAGYGGCVLREREVAEILQTIIMEGHLSNYVLFAWCIMPNHVHALIKQGSDVSLGEVIKNWKGKSARLINQCQKTQGSIWARDYFDRKIRNEEHFYRAIRYIERNPVIAGLAYSENDWEFSSSGAGWFSPQGLLEREL